MPIRVAQEYLAGCNRWKVTYHFAAGGSLTVYF
jgi:hypothetical protein